MPLEINQKENIFTHSKPRPYMYVHIATLFLMVYQPKRAVSSFTSPLSPLISRSSINTPIPANWMAHNRITIQYSLDKQRDGANVMVFKPTLHSINPRLPVLAKRKPLKK